MFQELEELEHKIDLPYEVLNALAWWIASELIRRHPNVLRVIETHPGGECTIASRSSIGRLGKDLLI